MAQQDEQKAVPPRRRNRPVARTLLRIGGGLAVVLLLLAGVGALLSSRPITLPVWMVATAEGHLNRVLADQGSMTIGRIELSLNPRQLFELRLRDLRISPPGGGGGHVQLPEVVARFGRRALAMGRVEPVAIRMSGARIMLRREADGRFDFDLGPQSTTPGNFGELLERVDTFFAVPFLAPLRKVEAEAITLSLDDRRAGRVWTIGDGRAIVTRTAEETLLDFGMALENGGLEGSGPDPATAQLTFGIRHDGEGVRLAARIAGVSAPDIAAQTPLLAWLGLLDAPISGDLRAALDGVGHVTALDGSLDIGAGALSPAPGAAPVPIRAAGISFAYDDVAGRFIANRLAVDSPTLRLRAMAHADPISADAAGGAGYVAQVQFDEVAVDPAGVFAAPVRFADGALDMRLRLDPFSVEIGQLALQADHGRLLARGRVGADATGWQVALDADLDTVTHDRLLALWPLALAPRTREWVAANVQQGELTNARAAIRLHPDHAPRLALQYDFSGADVRYMPTLPPIQGGRGYAMLHDDDYTMVVEDGHVTPPEGGRIAVTRSVFRVADVRVKPPPAEITLQTRSSLTAALSLLDQPPFGFLSKAGFRPDLATGAAQLTARMHLPLKQQVQLSDVDFTVTGTLTDVHSDRLVPGRVLTAAALELTADDEHVTIAGPGQLGAARFDARWTQPLGVAGVGEGGAVAGTVTLDAGFGQEFLAGFDPGAISGSAPAQIAITLPRGGPVGFTLQSDLAGAGVRLAALDWAKPAAARGELSVSGTLASPLVLDRVHLSGPGLSATGTMRLRADNTLDRADLAEVKLGGWLDARAEVTGQGPGRALVARISGGTADLRRIIGGSGLPGGGGGAALDRAPLSVTLDRVRISDTIALTGVQAILVAARGGIDGTFRGRLNGQAEIEGRMVPGTRGTAFQATAADAGAALTAAGIFTKGRGGTLELILNPTGGAGGYEGNVRMHNVRVREMPVLAELLNAISIVGLIEQLSAAGLLFGEAGGDLRLTPTGIELRNGYAVGTSFGVSLEGVYLRAEDRLDMQGVISPFYLLNAVGSVLTRRGEGLMGMTYRIRGHGSAPRVTVNPLSALAPGFFRDVLRRPPARMAE